jgi:hypothetical protein
MFIRIFQERDFFVQKKRKQIKFEMNPWGGTNGVAYQLQRERKYMFIDPLPQCEKFAKGIQNG